MYTVQTNTVVWYGHFELPRREKSEFEPEEKKLSLVLKMKVCGLKTQQISIFNFWFFFTRQLRVTIIDYCISLNSVQLFLVVLGVVDMCHLLLNKKLHIQTDTNVQQGMQGVVA